MKKIKGVFATLIAILISLFVVSPVSAADTKFSIDSATVGEKTDDTLVTIGEIDGLSIENRVVFHRIGDFATINLTIKNNSSYIRKIIGVSDDNENEAVSYLLSDPTGEELMPNESFDLSVKITSLLDSETADRDIENGVTIRISFEETALPEPDEPEELITPIAPVTPTDKPTDGETKTEEIEFVPSVPDTGKLFGAIDFSTSNFTVISLLIVTALGLVMSVILIMKKHPKAASRVVIVTFATMAFTPLAVMADDNIASVNFNSEIALRDMIIARAVEILDGNEDDPVYDDANYDDYEFIRENYPTVGLYTGSWTEDFYPGYKMVRATRGFGGPELSPDDLILDDIDMIFYYEPIKYTITYHLGDDSLGATLPTYCTVNSEIDLGTLERDGFRFDGWESDQIYIDSDNMIYGCEEDIDVYANWSQPTSHIYYYTNGHGSISDNYVGVPYGNEHRAIAAPQVDHYTFHGWDTEADGSGTRYNTGDLIKAKNTEADYVWLYAQWTPTDYDIAYALNGGTVAEANPTKYNIEGTYHLNNPTRDGKIFLGWTSNYNSTPSRNVSLNNEAYGPITFTANWTDPVPDITNFEYMQDVSIANCLSTDINVSTIMKDRRDNKQYTVKRLKDGNCWMTDSLNIYNIEISSADSDLPEGMTYTIPDSVTGAYTFNNREEYASIFPEDEVHNDPTYGTYYTYPAATALWAPVAGADSPQSICPKNWKLPTGGEGGEFEALYNAYPSAEEMLSEEGPHIVKNGLRAGNVTSMPGDDGFYWSSTTSAQSTRDRYVLRVITRTNQPSRFDAIHGTDRKFGSGIRCLIR